MVKRMSMLIVAALLLVMVAAGVLPEAQAAPAAQPRGVSDDNCAVTAFDIAGQGTGYIQGTSGGDLPPGLQRNQVILPTDAMLQIVESIGTTDVAILVIDDFFEYGDGIAHGRLVTDLLLAMIQANPVYAAAPQQVNAQDEPVIWSFAPSGYGRLLVVEVDTEDYNTDDLRDQVADAVALVQDSYDVQRMVLNMSFVLVPCVTPEYDLYAMRQDRQERTSQRPVLLAEVAQSRGVSVDLQRSPADIATAALVDDAASRELVNTVAAYASQTSQRTMNDDDPTALDPLHDYIKTLTGEGQYWNTSGSPVVVAVGSAGNFGRPLESLVPGAWPEVVSTSAFIGPRIPWVSSNKGQIMLPGGLYQVDDGYLIGTSFSAPLFSMNMAFYLTNSTLCPSPPLTLDMTDFPDDPIARVINTRCTPVFAAPGR